VAEGLGNTALSLRVCVTPRMPLPSWHWRCVIPAQAESRIVEQLGGGALPGLGVVTRVGVRVPDVIWQPRPTADDPASPAPDICVEVQSPDNTRRELDEKVAAYLDAGAREVILVDLAGRIRHFSAAGETEVSPHGLRLTVPEGTYPVR
jgi:Uma2 family endonuclease